MIQVKAGDQAAFRRLYEHYKGPIMSYLQHMVQNQKTAEELTQESFLKVYRFREKFEPELKFTAWLWTIARNAALDHLRHTGLIGFADSSLDLADEGARESTIDRIEDPSPSSEARLIEGVDREQVTRCLSKLTPAQRDALMLRTLSELTYEEIAKEMSLSLSSVKSLINRAKAGLIRCVSQKERS